MNNLELAKRLFHGTELSDKLADKPLHSYSEGTLTLKAPGRNKKISFSKNNIKFPRKTQLINPIKRSIVLHFFANHELLAIELFSWSLLKFNFEPDEIRNIYATIRDEQKHLGLYLDRMADFDTFLGDYPLNDYLWRTISEVSSKQEFYAVMALTFEQANLDFMLYYQSVFNELEDFETVKILEMVYQDEIIHVRRGVNYLNRYKNDQPLWDYYKGLLPEDVSPARAKGMIFDHKGRERATLEQPYIETLRNYSDSFSVTHRKEWKKTPTL